MSMTCVYGDHLPITIASSWQIPNNMRIKAIYFDLDDTLYGASECRDTAISEVYEYIAARYGVREGALRERYAELLHGAESHAFVNGRTSAEYRAERFQALVQHFGILDRQLIPRLLRMYSIQLESNMQPLPGTHQILAHLQQDFSLYVVTEGPTDAQTRALHILGLAKYFEGIFTSGAAQAAKADGGLFRFALDESRLKAYQVIHVGDSYHRDVLGAMKVGLSAIWLNSTGQAVPVSQPEPQAQIPDLTALPMHIRTHLP